jgi:hypothetical protein
MRANLSEVRRQAPKRAERGVRPRFLATIRLRREQLQFHNSYTSLPLPLQHLIFASPWP